MTALAVVPSQSSEGELARVFAVQRAAFAAVPMPDRAARLDRLTRLERMIEREADRFAAAIAEDFGVRSKVVMDITETMPVRSAIRHAKRHLRSWMRTRRVGVSAAFLPGRAKIVRQPLGVVGIVAPWNYPVQLLFAPLVGALAAGDRAMLKPSELTPAFAEVAKASVAEFFAEDEVAVVTGGPDVAAEFTCLPFDHLIFTGSTAVGRIVAQAAAKNLTPVTLELGGKSPVIIDESADLKTTAERLVWGKLINSGQTCIAPDYALVPRQMVDALVEAMRTATGKQYPTVAGNPDYASIVSDRHFGRLNGLVADARSKGAKVVELGSGGDAARRIFPPTLLLCVGDDMTVMQEEIFGPVLPIVSYDTIDEAIAYVNGRDRPLALYFFGADRARRETVLRRTISGGVTVNDTLMHISQDDLPFGGVGASGVGHYHGERGFLALSKEKPVFLQSRLSSGAMLYPPYGPFTRRLVGMLSRFG